MNTEQIMQIVYLVVILAIAWVVLRVVLKMAARVFACGCGAILAIGVLIYLVRYFTNTM